MKSFYYVTSSLLKAIGVIPPNVQKTIARAQAINAIGNLTWNQSDEYTPTSASDLSNSNNTGKTAILTGIFDATGVTLAPNQILVPNGGRISGTNINLNDATIAINYLRGFHEDARFVSLYPESKGCLFPELFGGNSSIDNADAVEAMILNAEAGFNKIGETYPINSPKTYTRGGVFKWNGNNSSITSSYVDSGTNTHLFRFENQTRHEFTDLDIDGGNNLKRFAYSIESDFALDNVQIRNLISTTRTNSDRCLAYRVVLTPSTGANDFKIYNSTFEDYECWGGGVPASGTDGVTKGFWFSYENINIGDSGNIDIHNCDVNNMLGEDAEFVFFAGGSNGFVYDHNIIARITNSRFDTSTRRFIKGFQSNVGIENCTFVREGAGTVVGGHDVTSGATTGVGLGSTDNASYAQRNRNSYVKNCTFTHKGDPIAAFINVNDCENAEVSGNHFTYSEIYTRGHININRYNVNTKIFNNTHINGGYGLGELSSTNLDIEIYDNTFDITVGTDMFNRAILVAQETTSNFHNIHFHDNDIDIVYNSSYASGNPYGGFLHTRWSSVTCDNLVIEDNNVTMSGSGVANQKLIYTVGDFGSTNRIQNTVATGATASGIFRVDGGTQNFQNVNNVDGNSNPLTVQ